MMGWRTAYDCVDVRSAPYWLLTEKAEAPPTRRPARLHIVVGEMMMEWARRKYLDWRLKEKGLPRYDVTRSLSLFFLTQSKKQVTLTLPNCWLQLWILFLCPPPIISWRIKQQTQTTICLSTPKRADELASPIIRAQYQYHKCHHQRIRREAIPMCIFQLYRP